MKTALAGFLLLALVCSPTFARTQATGNVNFYINGDPNNPALCANDTLTCGPGSDTLGTPPNTTPNPCTDYNHPCLTNDNAIWQGWSNWDYAGYTPVFYMADGSSANYQTTCAFGAWLGTVTGVVVGNYSNPSLVKVITPSGQSGIDSADLCWLSISSFEIDDSGSATAAVTAGQAGVMDVRSIVIGGTTWNIGSVLFQAQNGGRVNMLGADTPNDSMTNTINSTSIGVAFQAQDTGVMNLGQTVNIPNAITMQGNQPFAMGLNGTFSTVNTGTFTGYGATHATGHKCQMDDTYIENDLIPNNIFPGSINCTPYGPF